MVERATNPIAKNSASSRRRSVKDTGDRQLALEVRSRRYAFAVFQGSDLLDWGAGNYASGMQDTDAGIGKLRFLLNLYAPPVVVVRQTRPVKGEATKTATAALRRIGTELKRSSVRLVVVSRYDIRRFFAPYSCHTKHDVASLLADRFPELKSKLPRRRKPWDTEAHAMAVFDAIGTAVAFGRVPLSPSGR